jgi:hypothetical protein
VSGFSLQHLFCLPGEGCRNSKQVELTHRSVGYQLMDQGRVMT